MNVNKVNVIPVLSTNKNHKQNVKPQASFGNMGTHSSVTVRESLANTGRLISALWDLATFKVDRLDVSRPGAQVIEDAAPTGLFAPIKKSLANTRRLISALWDLATSKVNRLEVSKPSKSEALIETLSDAEYEKVQELMYG